MIIPDCHLSNNTSISITFSVHPLCTLTFLGAAHISRLLRAQVRYFKYRRAVCVLIMEATRSRCDAVAVRRARFFQARPCRIEIKTSQLFRMPQAHRRSCDKNQPIIFLTFSITLKPQQKNGGAAYYCGLGIS